MKLLNVNLPEQKGFTLIELSIVLVIIGLIVGGILTGQDLIKAAEQRATIAQLEKYSTAVNTFRNKYNGIPGDLAETSAAAFGLYDNTTPTLGTKAGVGNGDGNGIIEGSNVSSSVTLIGEPAMFWRHLSDASLIDGSFGANLAANAGSLALGTAAVLPTYIPTAKLGRGNLIIVASTGGINYYGIGGFTSVTTATGVYAAGTNNLTPQESYNMDKKVDDGLPASGTIHAISVIVALAAAGFAPATEAPIGNAGVITTACTNTTPTPVVYQLTSSVPECSLRWRFN